MTRLYNSYILYYDQTSALLIHSIVQLAWSREQLEQQPSHSSMGLTLVCGRKQKSLALSHICPLMTKVK